MGDFLLIEDPSCLCATAQKSDSIRSSFLPLRVVVVGGGTGSSSSIRALRSLGIQPDAVVAMADDGGSTGLLRSLDDVTPPGDIRKCLVALSKNPQDPFVKIFSGRMPDVSNHALGNLILAAYEDMYESFPRAIEACEKLLDTCGHVYPSTLDHVNFVAKNARGDIIFGQHDASSSESALKNVGLLGANGDPQAYEPAIRALMSADVIVLGPGSLFTSVIPNLLVPGISEAICKSNALVIYVCSLLDEQGETRGFTVADYIDCIERFGLQNRINAVIAQADFGETNSLIPPCTNTRDCISISQDEIEALENCATHVFARDLCSENSGSRHDVGKLSRVFAEVIEQCRLPQM